MPQTQVLVFREASGEVPFNEWIATLKKRNPKAYAKCLARIDLLSRHGNELRRPIVDYLRDGIYELRAKCGKVNYRMLYFFNGRNVAIISHGLTKEDKVPDHDIDLAIQHFNLVLSDQDKYTADFEP